MLEIIFEYRDAWSNGNWNEQRCIASSVQECKKFYGLGVDCDYRIVSVRKIS